jgi:hypothetical protein
MDGSDTLLQLLIPITFLFILFLLIWQLIRTQSNNLEQKIHSELLDLYKRLNGEVQEYRFFTTGHPYVWVETSQLEMEAAITASPRTASSLGAHIYARTNYAFKIDEEKKAIYYVPNVRSFDFSHRMHYNEWLESQQAVAKKIAENKQKL